MVSGLFIIWVPVHYTFTGLFPGYDNSEGYQGREGDRGYGRQRLFDSFILCVLRPYARK